MTGGFAFVAYPAEYRSSGVMTFIAGVDGVVYQKDLGKKTEVLARGMKEYNPDSSWQKTKEQEEMAADPKASGRNSGDDLLTTPSRSRSSVLPNVSVELVNHVLLEYIEPLGRADSLVLTNSRLPQYGSLEISSK